MKNRFRHTAGILSILLTLPALVSAQRTEFGYWLGGSTYTGDLNTNTSFQDTRQSLGIYYRYNYDSRVAVKTSAYWSQVAGNDAHSDNKFQLNRNLNFYSDVYEVSSQIEFNFKPYSSQNKKDKWAPYFIAGFSLLSFNPKTTYEGSVVRLQPLGTEGQGLPEYPDRELYKLRTTAWVVGGGLKVKLSKNLSFHIEGANRKTHTDYLDDVSLTYVPRNIMLNENPVNGFQAAALADRSASGEPGANAQGGKQRGDLKKRDSYFYFGIGFSFTINRYNCPFVENRGSR